MAKKDKHITKEDLTQIEKSAVRKEQKEQGAFDGRFATKSIPSKKAYSRKKKHKKKEE